MIRAPSEIRQLNDGISFPIVGTLEVRVDDIYGLFDSTSGIREYKNLDEILARLFISGTGGGGGGGGSGVFLRTNGIPLGKFGTINFSGVDVKVTGSGDVSDVVIDPSVRIQDDGIPLGRAKAINFSGVGFVVQLVDGVATVISSASGTGGGIAGVQIQDEGLDLGTYSKLNFSGAGVTARQDGDKVTVIVQEGVTQMRADSFAWFIRGGI